jgi:Zn-dependent protease/predicted transcriptional regulator
MRVAGIPIRIDASWIVIALVVTWSLAVEFTRRYPLRLNPGLTVATYWVMAGVGALSLFVCLILHELGHSLVGQRFGMRIRSITLFIFGGVAELESEPKSAKGEFWMAVAGPAVSLALAVGFWILWVLGGVADWPVSVLGVLRELAVINAILVGFNLVPAFPLDGGRVLRAILWATTKNLKQATSITSQMGSGFGTAMMLLGMVGVLGGQIVFGMWWLMLGWFLRGASQSGYQQVIVRAVLQGEPVQRFMTREVSSVRSDIDVEHLVEDYVYREHHQMYPVRDNGHLLGYVTPREIKTLPRVEWPQHRVAEIMASDLDRVEISPDTDSLDALTRMQRTDQSRLLVVDHGTLVGIVTLKDLLDFLTLKLELDAA